MAIDLAPGVGGTRLAQEGQATLAPIRRSPEPKLQPLCLAVSNKSRVLLNLRGPEEPDGAVAPPGRAALARQGFITWVVYIQVGYPVGELRVSTNPLTGVRNARLFPAR